MGIQLKGFRVGGYINYGSYAVDNTYITWRPIRVEDKSFSGKRVRPKGLDILFQGTSVMSSKDHITPAVLVETFPLGAGAYSVLSSLITAGHQGADPFGSNIPDSKWANKLRSQVKDSDINLAQSFAERKQTVNMFADYGKRVIKAYSSLRKGNVNGVFNALLGTGNRPPKGWKRTIRDTTGVASDSWLAYQYGIRPLISDLNGAVKEYYKVRAVAPIIRTFRTNASNDARAGGTTSGLNPPSMSSTNAYQSARIKCYVEFEDSAQAWDQSADRLGLTDPVLLAWELIPYSFVIDWFVNVGEFLSASGSIAGMKRIGLSVTTTTTYESTYSKLGATSRRRTTVVSRDFRNNLPGATLQFNATPFSASHVLSGLALIRQLR